MPQADDAPTLFKAAPLPTAELDTRQRIACLRLIRSENVGPVTFRDLINHFGGAEAALAAVPELSRRGGRRQFVIASESVAAAELEAAERAGARPVFTIEPGYPAHLAAVDVPPPLVYVKGDTALFERPGIAIVGSRNCSAAGGTLARQFAGALGDAGFAIVSGLARGIDGIAHTTALPTGTIAVVAGGIDIVYPPEHAALQNEIAARGCLITEMPPGFKPRGSDFPRRNRIISGLSLGVVIVEAAARSGTLVTARFAAEQGREVFAVPGHPLDPRAEGTNKLIQNGAMLVTSADDVIGALRPMIGLAEPARDQGPDLPRGSELSAVPPQAAAIDDGVRAAVLAALGPAPVEIDDLARVTGLSSRQVQVALVELDLAGRLERQGQALVALKLGG